MKLNKDENIEPTGGEKFLLSYTASSTWDQIKYMSWTTAEVIDVMNLYHDKGNPNTKDPMKLNAEDMLQILEDYKRTFVKVNFFAYFVGGIVKELDYHIVEYGLLDEEQVANDIKDCTDWLDHVEIDGDMLKDGYYVVDAMFRIETDGDDFRDWSWGELEHAEFAWAHSKEDADAQMKETDNPLEDLFI